MAKIYRALGLMSGTSLDGIDVALIETDGLFAVKPLAFETYPYEPDFRARMQACFGKRRGTLELEVAEAERESTQLHIDAVRAFAAKHALDPKKIDVIGYHGQTVWHDPAARETIALGDGAALARAAGIDVVADMRKADVLAGGQGAPLLPLYHRALAADLPKPVAMINIGGIANVTWIGGPLDEDILAFDTGPGNAPINDWMLAHFGKPYDEDGQCAASGKVDEGHILRFLDDPYFRLRGPKSLDRDYFKKYVPHHLEAPDGAATLTMMSVQAIAHGLRQMGKTIREIYLCGGGAHNGAMRLWLHEATGAPIGLVDDLGWHGDALEAEGWAYLAVRSLLGLPLTLPGTTGCPEPLTGGALFKVGKIA